MSVVLKLKTKTPFDELSPRVPGLLLLGVLSHKVCDTHDRPSHTLRHYAIYGRNYSEIELFSFLLVTRRPDFTWRTTGLCQRHKFRCVYSKALDK